MEGLFLWRAAFKKGKRSYVGTHGKILMVAGQNRQQLGGSDRLHLELNHLSAGAWSGPVDIDSRELFPLKPEECPDFIRVEESII